MRSLGVSIVVELSFLDRMESIIYPLLCRFPLEDLRTRDAIITRKEALYKA